MDNKENFEMEIVTDLVRSLMFYAIINGWEIEKLNKEYARLGIPHDLVDEVLTEGALIKKGEET